MNRLRALMNPAAAPVAKTFHLEGNPCLVATLGRDDGLLGFLISYFS